MVVCSPPQLMWDITIHPPSGPSVLTGTLSFLRSMWDCPQIHPPPHLGPVSLLAHRSVFGSDTIYNTPDPPLADIVLFGLSLLGFKTRLLGEGFHTLINGDLFSSPTNVGHHSYCNETEDASKNRKHRQN